MSYVEKLWIEGYVFALFDVNDSYSIIQKRYDRHDIKISRFKISNIIYWKEKCRQPLLLHGKRSPNKYPNIQFILFQIFSKRKGY